MTQVVKMIQSWRVHLERNGGSATRKYMSASLFTGDPSLIVDLPEISDKWNDELPYLRVNEILIEKPTGCDGRFYTVNYSSGEVGQIPDPSETEDSDPKYPLTLTVSSENFTYSTDAEYKGKELNKDGTPVFYADGKILGHWIWPDKTLANDITFMKREVTLDFSLTREVSSNTFSDFFRDQLSYVGTINNDEPLGIPSGLLLYVGANVTQASNWRDGEHKWIAEQHFLLKTIDGEWSAINNGWNYTFDPETNSYSKKIDPTTNDYLYVENQFSGLLNNYQTNQAADIFPPMLE